MKKVTLNNLFLEESNIITRNEKRKLTGGRTRDVCNGKKPEVILCCNGEIIAWWCDYIDNVFIECPIENEDSPECEWK